MRNIMHYNVELQTIMRYNTSHFIHIVDIQWQA